MGKEINQPGNQSGCLVFVALLILTPTFLLTSVYPVTNKQFCAFLNELHPGADDPRDESGNHVIEFDKSRISSRDGDEEGNRPFHVKDGYENHPVTGVTCYGEVAFCNWRSGEEGLPAGTYRLLTEQEWEKAARIWGNEMRQKVLIEQEAAGSNPAAPTSG